MSTKNALEIAREFHLWANQEMERSRFSNYEQFYAEWKGDQAYGSDLILNTPNEMRYLVAAMLLRSAVKNFLEEPDSVDLAMGMGGTISIYLMLRGNDFEPWPAILDISSLGRRVSTGPVTQANNKSTEYEADLRRFEELKALEIAKHGEQYRGMKKVIYSTLAEEWNTSVEAAEQKIRRARQRFRQN